MIMNKPILNPVLVFNRDPRRDLVTGRGFKEEQVQQDRLLKQRKALGDQVAKLADQNKKSHGGKLLACVQMFQDSLSPTYEPSPLFKKKEGSQLVAPIKNGYLVQLSFDDLPSLGQKIKNNQSLDTRVLLSRVKSIEGLSSESILNNRDEEMLWSAAIESNERRIFSVWFLPYDEAKSREEVVGELMKLKEKKVFAAINDLVSVTREAGAGQDQLKLQSSDNLNSFFRAVRNYRQGPFAHTQLAFSNIEGLRTLIASGSIFKIEPVRPLVATELKVAPDPERPILNEDWQPIVGVVDGGFSAQSYKPMIAWEAPSLVSDVVANKAHGNRVKSLVIQGNEWNTHLDLPSLTCRVGVAQAIAKNNLGSATRVGFRSYLREVVSQHHGSTKVWNLSFNEEVTDFEPLEMSSLGHEIHQIAREFNILPVISIGNVSKNNATRLNPPADCEAALTVGGRSSDNRIPSTACLDCLPGPGPAGLTKPELSWFSSLRAIGGETQVGSSYAAAIVSTVAAHTFHQLKEPSPDLVRALLINTADRDLYDSRVGWGSPFKEKSLPWMCREGRVTLLWSAELRAGEWHYWDDIPIPPELISEGKLRGGVYLTAILNPLVSELGAANYFSTRLQVALQYKNLRGDWRNLAGSMKMEAEDDSNSDQAKWNPIRHHAENIPRGRAFSGDSLRICARVFGRDLYQFGYKNNAEIPSSDVAFALSLQEADVSKTGGQIYNSVASKLGAYVESAVNDLDIDLSV